MKNKIMSEEAFNELIENIEVVSELTLYGRKNIKYYVNKLQQENKILKDTVNKAKNYIKMNCEIKNKECLLILYQEEVKELFEILDNKGE